MAIAGSEQGADWRPHVAPWDNEPPAMDRYLCAERTPVDRRLSSFAIMAPKSRRISCRENGRAVADRSIASQQQDDDPPPFPRPFRAKALLPDPGGRRLSKPP